jgi:hypothetical protein
MTTKNSTHSNCDHPATKSARSACRRAKLVETTDIIVNHTFVFVRRARAEGHVNLIHRITLDEIAQEHGYTPREWDPKLACRMVRDRANAMGEWNILADEMLQTRD